MSCCDMLSHPILLDLVILYYDFEIVGITTSKNASIALEGSFSAVSKPIFGTNGTKYLFYSIF